MLTRKRIRERGKLSLSKYFQELEKGDKVAVVREQSQDPRFPKRIQGLSGIVMGKRGKAVIIKIKEGNKEKTHIIKPVHLKKLKQTYKRSLALKASNHTMITDREPLNMQEANNVLKGLKETEKIKETKAFIKKFSKVSAENAKKMKEELEKLELIKLKPTDIAKIVDILPEDAAELNKIITEVTLDADETNKILETVKKNK